MHIGESILQEVYDQGIILVDNGSLPADGIINVVKHNIGEEHALSDYLTIQSAFDFIEESLDKDAAHRVSTEDKEFLLPLLENSLSQNVLYDADATRQWTKQLLDNISPTRGLVQNSEVIVVKGQVVDEERHLQEPHPAK